MVLVKAAPIFQLVNFEDDTFTVATCNISHLLTGAVVISVITSNVIAKDVMADQCKFVRLDPLSLRPYIFLSSQLLH